jgi:hypothetical protein
MPCSLLGDDVKAISSPSPFTPALQTRLDPQPLRFSCKRRAPGSNCRATVVFGHAPTIFGFQDLAKTICSLAARRRIEPRERFNCLAMFETLSPARAIFSNLSSCSGVQ